MSTLAEVMAPVRHVLLDFDGPVCSVFGNLPAPEVARRLAAAIDEDMPAAVVGTDPLALLSVFAERDHEVLVAAEAKLRELEVEAVLSAPITPGVVEALQAFHDTGRAVTIVSNNSVAAVRRFLDDHHLDHLVTGVSSRESSDPSLLKPRPHLLNRAVRAQSSAARECVMIGDSITDVLAARAAEVSVIALANKPDKVGLFCSAPEPPRAVIYAVRELVEPAQRSNSVTELDHPETTGRRGRERGPA